MGSEYYKKYINNKKKLKYRNTDEAVRGNQPKLWFA